MIRCHIVQVIREINALILARHSGYTLPHMLVIAMPKEIQVEQKYQHEMTY